MSPGAAPATGGAPEAVAFLRDPRTHGGAPVTVVETHLSWVFLTPTRVYKLKKPVRYPFVDLSSAAARRRNCQAELRLNRALAPSVYLSVQALRRQPDGTLSLGGRRGRAVDWVVTMRRLPDSSCLEWQLRRGCVDRAGLRLAARRLARFHRDAPLHAPVDVPALRTRLEMQAAELAALVRAAEAPAHNATGLAGVRGVATAAATGVETARTGLAPRQVLTGEGLAAEVGALHRALLASADELAGELARRPRREVHGDLRPEHVYPGPDPVFIDRLEFSLELRVLDPLEEQAFLALECARLGAPEVGRRFLCSYRALSGDRPAPGLWGFYTARRALTWAVLAARHVPRGGDPVHWYAVTADYVRRGLGALGAGACRRAP